MWIIKGLKGHRFMAYWFNVIRGVGYKVYGSRDEIYFFC
jgi:hypothetical protein